MGRPAERLRCDGAQESPGCPSRPRRSSRRSLAVIGHGNHHLLKQQGGAISRPPNKACRPPTLIQAMDLSGVECTAI